MIDPVMLQPTSQLGFINLVVERNEFCVKEDFKAFLPRKPTNRLHRKHEFHATPQHYSHYDGHNPPQKEMHTKVHNNPR